MSARLDSCRNKAGAILILVFVLGLTTGVLITNLTSSGRAEADLHAERVNSTLGDLIEHLSLQPDQIEQVRGVLDDIIMAEADLLSRIKWNQMEGRGRIMQFLEPDQQERFTALIDGGEYAPLK